MEEKREHTIIGRESFILMRNLYLEKVKDEINICLDQMRNLNTSIHDDYRKEISLTIISALLRKCVDLKLIEITNKRSDFNSIIHAHQVYHLVNGDFVILSDDDIKYKRKGATINKPFLEDLKKDVVSWKNNSEI